MAENQENTPDKTDGERKVQQLNIELSHSGHIAQNEIFFQKDKLKRSLSADHIALQSEWKKEEAHQKLQKISEDLERKRVEQRTHDLSLRGKIGFVVGPFLFVASLLVLTDKPSGTSTEDFGTVAVFFLVGTWWLTEPVPLAVTSLLPIILLPALGIVSVDEAAAPYGSPLIFLFLGGFLIALALQSCNLHNRIALLILQRMSANPASIIGGFMLSAAVLSMWVSNTATSLMMVPIAESVISLYEKQNEGSRRNRKNPFRNCIPGETKNVGNFRRGILLGLAFSCSIGGLATLIGTPPNALVAGIVEDSFGIKISFSRWLMLGLPVSAVLLLLTWIILTKFTSPVSHQHLDGWQEIIDLEVRNLGPFTEVEKRVSIIFCCTAILWIIFPFIEDELPFELSDAAIGLLGGTTMFLVPRGDNKPGMLLSWKQTQNLPWGVLILIGGGLSIAQAMDVSGISDFLGSSLRGLDGAPTLLIIIIVCCIMMLISHLMSNTATASTLLPAIGSLAKSIDVNVLQLTVPAALAASAVFMMPQATPPNAIVYASGRVTVAEMSKNGIAINLMAMIVISLMCFGLVKPIFPDGS